MPVQRSFLSTEGSQPYPGHGGGAGAQGRRARGLRACDRPPAQDSSSAALPAGQAGHSEVAVPRGLSGEAGRDVP